MHMFSGTYMRMGPMHSHAKSPPSSIGSQGPRQRMTTNCELPATPEFCCVHVTDTNWVWLAYNRATSPFACMPFTLLYQ